MWTTQILILWYHIFLIEKWEHYLIYDSIKKWNDPMSWNKLSSLMFAFDVVFKVWLPSQILGHYLPITNENWLESDPVHSAGHLAGVSGHFLSQRPVLHHRGENTTMITIFNVLFCTTVMRTRQLRLFQRYVLHHEGENTKFTTISMSCSAPRR